MRRVLPFVLTIIISVTLYCCNKGSSTSNVIPINCNGLITDTSGKNDSAKLIIPNAFTPNGDAINDYFGIQPYKIDSIDFTIYDDNNNIVFNTKKLGGGWTPAQDSIQWRKYYYKIQAVTSKKNKLGVCGEFYRLDAYQTFYQKTV